MTNRLILITIEGRDKASGVLHRVGSSLGNIAQIASGILAAGFFTRIAQGIANIGQEALTAIADYERLGFALQSLTARELLNTGQADDMASAYAMAAGKAQELLKWTQDLAIRSPFDQEGVAMAFKTAMAYGFTAEQSKRLTKAEIDFASATGANSEVMNRISLALGQIQAKGKLAGQEVLQLVNAGLPVTQILAKAFGVTTAELMEMQKDGLIPADKAIEAILTSLETDFGGAAERQTQTWSGLLNTLGDLKKMGLRELFGGIAEALQPIVAEFANWLLEGGGGLEKLKEWGQELGKIADWIIGVGQAIVEAGLFSPEFMESISGLFPQDVQDRFFAFMRPFVDFLHFMSQWWAANGPPIIEQGQRMWDAFILGLQAIQEKAQPFMEGVLAKITLWFAENGPLIQAFAAVIADAFVNNIMPAIVAAWDVIAPIFSGLIDLILGIAKLIMQVATGDWAGAWETIKQIVIAVGAAIWDAIVNFLNMIAVAMGSSLSEIGAMWSGSWQAFLAILDNLGRIISSTAKNIIGGLVHTFNQVVTAIQNVITWIGRMTAKLTQIELPGWLMPGSPTPFELGLRGIGNAMAKLSNDALPSFSANVGRLSGTGVGAGGGGVVINLTYAPMLSMADENELQTKLMPFIRNALRET